MILNLRDFTVSVQSGILADLKGNWMETFDQPIANYLYETENGDDLFSLPLPVTFHRHPDGTLWLDWTEAGTATPDSRRLQVTLADRLIQACNDVRNRFSISFVTIQESGSVPEDFLSGLHNRLLAHLFQIQHQKL